jgi:ATP-dependent RNA helicase HelY
MSAGDASDLSPSERYAAARRRRSYPRLTDFRADYSFPLDPFQVEAAEALEDGYGVLVCAPTGAGKTVVGEFAVHLALEADEKCFYTTPIKALSNQKYADLVARHGPEKVGLLTGDNAVNGDAPIVVMTTEVLRNMLYIGSPALQGLGYVVMDEVHYLGDRFRGAVWEEVIIHLPAAVRLVSLSATVSNAEEFGDWLVAVRGDTKVVVHEVRPVPLWQHLMVGTRMFDLFDERSTARRPELNEAMLRHVHQRRTQVEGGMRRGPREDHRRWRPPARQDVIAQLDSAGLLPAITFVFSRAGCDAAVRQCVLSGVRLIDEDQRARVRAVVALRTAALAQEDLGALGFHDWVDGLERGIAAHHAGMIPVFKETVEELFVAGLVRVVFATETLALGINMPARTVVLERLVKFNGETHADITPGEYTQLTGRAGRRGIDIEGHAVVVWGPEVDPERVAGLASTRTYPLRSSFRPSYNMAVNLVGQMGRDAARELLGSSFAQFQADRAVHGLTVQVSRLQEAADGLARDMACHLGDFAEYAQLRRRLKDRETELSRAGAASQRASSAASLEALRPGDIIRIPSGRRRGLAVVLDPGVSAHDDPRPLVLTAERWAGRLSLADFPRETLPLGRMSVPKRFNHRSPQARRDLATTLRITADRIPAASEPVPHGRRNGRGGASGAAFGAMQDLDADVVRLRAALRAHPCHGCADREQHARVAERRQRLEREISQIRGKVEGRTNSLARMFDRICALLDELGYLSGEDVVTADGAQLARIWSDSDLLIAQCLRTGAWDGLGPAELAAVASSVIYESRRDDGGTPRVPDGAVAEAIGATTALWDAMVARERALGLQPSREPDLGFVWAAYRWARGDGLEKVLRASDLAGNPLPAGDFVRWCRQLVDLLEQIAARPRAGRGGGSVAAAARGACDALRRGVVAQSLSS